MKRIPALIFSCLIATFSMAVFSAPNCQNPANQIDTDECAVLEYKKADAQLNKLYKELMGNLEAEDKQQLKQVQLNWVKYKEAQCKLEGAKYGKMGGLIEKNCQTRITKQRNADFVEMLREG